MRDSCTIRFRIKWRVCLIKIYHLIKIINICVFGWCALHLCLCVRERLCVCVNDDFISDAMHFCNGSRLSATTIVMTGMMFVFARRSSHHSHSIDQWTINIILSASCVFSSASVVRQCLRFNWFTKCFTHNSICCYAHTLSLSLFFTQYRFHCRRVV